MVNIDKYIKWDEIWENEISLKTSIDYLEDDDKNIKTIGVVKQFKEDNDVELYQDECFLTEKEEFVFTFGETGGQNESDTQGWSRDYIFIFDKDFSLVHAEYSQG